MKKKIFVLPIYNVCVAFCLFMLYAGKHLFCTFDLVLIILYSIY